VSYFKSVDCIRKKEMEDVWETRQVQDDEGNLLAEHHRVSRDKGICYSNNISLVLHLEMSSFYLSDVA
jgi:hypothetical protein